MCNYWEYSVIWGKNVCSSTFNKNGICQGWNYLRRDFSLKLVAVDLLILILQHANAHMSNIFRFKKQRNKNYCWHFWFKIHFGVLCDTFCNTTYFLLILTTVFKSNPKRRSSSFYIPFVTWKMHFKHYWLKITIMTLLA